MKKWVKKFLYHVLIIVYNIVFEIYVGMKMFWCNTEKKLRKDRVWNSCFLHFLPFMFSLLLYRND